jgi:hypothetical protein
MKIRLTPNDWGNFQHYKDRSPAWIKLHKSLLDNYEFQCLPVASRALAPMLWLLASESKEPQIGVFEGDPEKLAFRLRISVLEIKQALKPLIESCFFSCHQDDSNLLAELLHNDSPEKRREETETETETETEKTLPRAKNVSKKAEDSPEQLACRETWIAYVLAYRERYQADPQRNAKNNALIKQFVRRLPHDEAPLVAAYFVSINDAFLCKNMHPLNLLLQGSDAYRTQWATGRQMTTSKAQQLDRTASNFDAVQEAIRMSREREARR